MFSIVFSLRKGKNNSSVRIYLIAIYNKAAVEIHYYYTPLNTWLILS